MKLLIENAYIEGFGIGYLATDGAWITSVTKERPAGQFDRQIQAKGSYLTPAFYNTHSHAAMTLFRGYGEDMPLQTWLNDCIFPAEDRLTPHAVYIASLCAAAEQIKNGIVSFSDMYFFCDQTVQAVAESGMKANISRSIVSFDPATDLRRDSRFTEACALYDAYHGAENGRIRIDFSLHAEYTNTESAARTFAEEVQKRGAAVQVHISETASEHAECKARHKGRTPLAFFADCGVLSSPTTAAHCVYVEDTDLALMQQYHVSVSHNPTSNLKLGSGIMPLKKLLDAGVNVTLGTDGTASNNRLDLLREMNLAALLHRGVHCDAQYPNAATILHMATENGAKAQGRPDCGILAPNYRADFVLWDLDRIQTIPQYQPIHALLYSSDSTNVALTVADGKILYENGNYTTLDIEKLKSEMKDVCAHYFD